MSSAHAGKQRRLGRLFSTVSGRTIILPIDDGLISGPKAGLQNLDEFWRSVEPALPDGVLLFPGILARYWRELQPTAVIVNLTASTVRSTHTQKVLCTEVETAVSLGADAVAVHVNMTSRYEAAMLKSLGTVVREAEHLGMPVLAIMYPRCELSDGSDDNFSSLREADKDAFAELVAHAARVGVELGADMIKTQYTGTCSSFAKVVSATAPVPVVIAGGAERAKEDVLNAAREAIEAGGAGVSFGRNVFGRSNPAQMLRELDAIVHGANRLHAR